ncbi:YhfT family protein, partial [Cetobacterium sp.]|uniref:YhfT family protein n=1 Tax=Cetobacterium sp. TaxID=2071632 RepID=UPI003F3B24D8
MNYIVAVLLGALASLLANRGVAIFNDGLRPIVPEFLEGRMDRKSLAATSLAISFGLVVGYGIPFSLTTPIILIHSILLGTDIIGSSFSFDKKGAILSTITGGFYGLLITLGLKIVVELFAKLPVNFLPALGKVGSPIVVAFAAFPALVVAYQYGFKKGATTFAATIVVRQIVQKYGTFVFDGSKIVLNSDGMALLVAMVIMIGFAMKEKPAADAPGSNTMLLNIFAARVERIKKNILPLSLMGGIISAAISLHLVAGDPISLNLLAEGKISEAGLAALARAIGFVPLVATTAIATGVYAPAGMTFVFALGIFLKNPLIAFAGGMISIYLEIYALGSIAKFLDKFPGVKGCGDQIRTAMSRVLEVSLIVGGMIAADTMAPGLGYLFVAGVYILNKTAKKPLV